jgi:hypothetical protein
MTSGRLDVYPGYMTRQETLIAAVGDGTVVQRLRQTTLWKFPEEVFWLFGWSSISPGRYVGEY